MDYTREEILGYIRQKSDHPMKMKELAKALSIPNPQYAQFRNIVKSLIDAGELVKLKRGRIGIAREMNMLVGTISITRGGTGFVAKEDLDQDILIPQSALDTALDGDKVMVRMTGQVSGRKAGAIVKVVERSGRNIVGVYHRSKHLGYVRADNPRIHRDIYIPSAHDQKAKEGEKVVCKLTVWDDPYINPEGEITERIGFPGEPGVDMKTVIKSFELPEEFPDEVLNAAEMATGRLSKGAEEGRLDLTRKCIYTIDPADAKDHDDGVSVERNGQGYRLGVHIADVSHFVQEGSELDKEALARGNSVYLPGMVIPMLPEILSNDACSLKPNRRRLAFSVFMEFDRHGKMLRWELADTVIKSAAKLAYEEVQEFFDSGAPKGKKGEKISRVAESLTLARELAKLLSQRRFAEGSLDFDLPEPIIEMDEQGEVLNISHKVRLEAHRLVEEFMLAANKAVALEMFRNAQPFIYRVHERPDLEKLESFSAMVARLGYKFPVSPQIRPKDLAQFLDQIKDEPEADFINELMLRSLKKAVYQRKNVGHFGLAFKHYTHFTSPIRRYPDLLVHRLLRKTKHGKYVPKFASRVESLIDTTANHCSETERVAEQAEREAIKVKQVQYMARHVGDEFDGIISGVTGFGFFVRLDNLGAEGLIRVSSIDDDYYNFDEERYSLIGRRTGRTFRLGDRVRVGIQSVDKTNNEISLFLLVKHGDDGVDEKESSKKSKGKSKSRGKAKSGGKKSDPQTGKKSDKSSRKKSGSRTRSLKKKR